MHKPLQINPRFFIRGFFAFVFGRFPRMPLPSGPSHHLPILPAECHSLFVYTQTDKQLQINGNFFHSQLSQMFLELGHPSWLSAVNYFGGGRNSQKKHPGNGLGRLFYEDQTGKPLQIRRKNFHSHFFAANSPLQAFASTLSLDLFLFSLGVPARLRNNAGSISYAEDLQIREQPLERR